MSRKKSTECDHAGMAPEYGEYVEYPVTADEVISDDVFVAESVHSAYGHTRVLAAHESVSVR